MAEVARPADAGACAPAVSGPVACASCGACCCRLEVILMGEDAVPARMIEADRWGGEVMARLDDGWCVALDRSTMLCRIYQTRPTVCREFEVGADECLSEREGSRAVRARADV